MRPSTSYMLGECPANMRGAPQVIRGPMYDTDWAGNPWIRCVWRIDGPPPGGWVVIRLRVCTRRTLPRWARRAIRGAGRAAMLRYLKRGAT